MYAQGFMSFCIKMDDKPVRILITGAPGVGKTTLVRNIATALHKNHPVGFFTEEIRIKGIRKGFFLVDFSGNKKVLAHVDYTGPVRVGRYGVDVAGFEDFLSKVDMDSIESGLIIIDEIGRMECKSRLFCQQILAVFELNKPLIATIALKGGGLISQVKCRDDTRLLQVTPRNREILFFEILRLFQGTKQRLTKIRYNI